MPGVRRRSGVAGSTTTAGAVADDHNLNRQILYHKAHVGKPKVDCAKEVLDASHNLRSEVVAVNTDAVKRWGDIVDITRGVYRAEGEEGTPAPADPVDIIFNSIDYGDAFDHAVSALCLRLDLPVILGGTEPWYGHTVSFFFQEQRSVAGSGPCFGCAHDSDSVKASDIATVQPDKVLGLRDISHLPKDVYPDKGGSTTFSAGTCSHMMVSQMVQYLLRKRDFAAVVAQAEADGTAPPPYSSEDASPHRVPPKNTVIFNMISFESQGWRTARSCGCLLCKDYHPEWEAKEPEAAPAEGAAEVKLED